MVDRYKRTKASEGVLSPNSITKTLTRLSQILAYAVEYDLLTANPLRAPKASAPEDEAASGMG